MDQLDDPADQAAVIHASKVVYRLYTDMFRELPGAEVAAAFEDAAHASL
jgi:hypothetical protein